MAGFKGKPERGVRRLSTSAKGVWDRIRGSKGERASLAIVGLLGLALPLTALSGFDYSRDNSIYLGLAQSIISGEGYRFDGAFHSQYPPGAPLLIAPVFWATGGDVPSVYRFVALVGAIGLLLSFLYYRRRNERWALLLTMMLALSATFYRYATGPVLAVTIYLALSLAFLIWTERARSGSPAVTPAGWLIGITLATAAVLVHSVGLALLVGVTLSVLYERWRNRGEGSRAVLRDARLWVALPAALALVGWWVWSTGRAEPAYPGEFTLSYFEQFRLLDAHNPDLGEASLPMVALRLWEHLVRDLAHAGELFTNLPWVKPLWFSPLVLIPAFLCGLGWWRELRRTNTLAAWYSACYFGLVIAWPYDEGRRLLVPILPLLLVFALEGIREIAARFGEGLWRRRGSTILMIVALIAVAAGGQLLLTPGALSRQDVFSLAFWIILFALGIGARTLRRPITRRQVRLATSAVAVCYLGVYAALGSVAIVRVAESNLNPTPSDWMHGRAALVAAWLGEHASPSHTVMASDYAPIHFVTGLKTVPLPITGRRQRLREALETTEPDYVVINASRPTDYYAPSESRRLEIIEKEYPGRLTPVHQGDGVRIFRFRAR